MSDVLPADKVAAMKDISFGPSARERIDALADSHEALRAERDRLERALRNAHVMLNRFTFDDLGEDEAKQLAAEAREVRQ